jgi:uncharacterized OsmC-like protein
MGFAGTLKSYLERKSEALKAARASASDNQAERMQHLTAQVTAEGGSGIRRVRIRDFQIITDAGPAMAGYDLGPRSPEVLLGALGSCISHTVLIQAAVDGLPLDSLVVDVSADIDSLAGSADVRTPLQNFAFEIQIESSADQEKFRRIIELLPEICPVLNVLHQPQTFETAIMFNGTRI